MTKKRLVALIALLVIIIAVPLTVWIAQQQQETRQRASGNNLVSADNQTVTLTDDPRSAQHAQEIVVDPIDVPTNQSADRSGSVLTPPQTGNGGGGGVIRDDDVTPPPATAPTSPPTYPPKPTSGSRGGAAGSAANSGVVNGDSTVRITKFQLKFHAEVISNPIIVQNPTIGGIQMDISNKSTGAYLRSCPNGAQNTGTYTIDTSCEVDFAIERAHIVWKVVNSNTEYKNVSVQAQNPGDGILGNNLIESSWQTKTVEQNPSSSGRIQGISNPYPGQNQVTFTLSGNISGSPVVQGLPSAYSLQADVWNGTTFKGCYPCQTSPANDGSTVPINTTFTVDYGAGDTVTIVWRVINDSATFGDVNLIAQPIPTATGAVAPVPTVSSVAASCSSANTPAVDIAWSVPSATGISHFTIQASTDGTNDRTIPAPWPADNITGVRQVRVDAQAGTQYWYRVVSRPEQGYQMSVSPWTRVAQPVSSCAPPPNTTSSPPPSVLTPPGLSAYSVGCSGTQPTLNLTWTAPQGTDLSGYSIQSARDLQGGNPGPEDDVRNDVSSVSKTATSHTFNVTAGSNRYYRIVARGTSSPESGNLVSQWTPNQILAPRCTTPTATSIPPTSTGVPPTVTGIPPTVTPTVYLAADINQNNCINTYDYNFWKNAFIQNVQVPSSLDYASASRQQRIAYPDINNDKLINLKDYNIWFTTLKSLPANDPRRCSDEGVTN